MFKGLLTGLSLVACLLLAACGGGGDSSSSTSADSSTDSTSSDVASNSLDDAIAEVNAAAQSGDCEQIAEVVNRTTSGGLNPTAPPSKEACKFYTENLAPILKEVEFDQSVQFGPAALIQGTASEKTRQQLSADTVVFDAVMFADPFAGDKWTYAYGQGDTIDQIGTEPADQEGITKTAEAFMDAVAAQDCDGLVESLDPDTNASNSTDPKDACPLFFDGPFGKNYADGAEVEYIGGTIDFAFFSVTPTDGSRTDTMYLSIIGDSQEGKMGVVDVLPTPAPE